MHLVRHGTDSLGRACLVERASRLVMNEQAGKPARPVRFTMANPSLWRTGSLGYKNRFRF
jgi:hypothetical protein